MSGWAHLVNHPGIVYVLFEIYYSVWSLSPLEWPLFRTPKVSYTDFQITCLLKYNVLRMNIIGIETVSYNICAYLIQIILHICVWNKYYT